MSNLSLEESPHDWLSLIRPISEEMEAARASGTMTPTQVIANAARQRGLTPRALGKQVLAARFLEETYPMHLMPGERIAGGYSQVEYLAKIHQLDPERANRLVGPVLAGEVSMAQMRTAYEEVVAATGGPNSNSARTKQRGLAFEAACEQAIRSNPERFGLEPGAVLVSRYRVLDTTLDYAVVVGGHPVSAIEVRIGGLAAPRREAFSVTSRLALLARKIPSVVVLVPASSQDLADALEACIRGWGVEGVRVATVEETEPYALVG